MRRRELNGLAHAIGHQFSVSAYHFAEVAARLEVARVRVDVLNLRIEPALFEREDRNLKVVRICRETVRRWLAADPSRHIAAAFVEADFTLLPAAQFWGEVHDRAGHIYRRVVVPQGNAWQEHP